MEDQPPGAPQSVPPEPPHTPGLLIQPDASFSDTPSVSQEPAAIVPEEPISSPVTTDPVTIVEPATPAITISAPPAAIAETPATTTVVVDPAPALDVTLPPTTVTTGLFVATQPTANKKSKLPLILGVVIILVVLIGGGSYALFGHKSAATKVVTASHVATTPVATGTTAATGYEAAIQKFITAIQSGDKATADSLQSPAFSQSNQTQAGNTSFYSACQSAGVYCTDAFAKTYLDSGTKTTKAYTASNGTKGEEDDYTISSFSTSATSSSNSTNTVSIAAVPSGSTWLIDYVNEGGSSSASGS